MKKNINLIACMQDYDDVVKDGYGLDMAALSSVLFNHGEACGACYEIKCVNSPQWCKPGKPSILSRQPTFAPPIMLN